MDQIIEHLKSTTFGGRRFTRKQIAHIQSVVKTFPDLSRRELSNTLCEHFEWVTPAGVNSSQACLNALEQMEAANVFKLPDKIESKVRGKKKPLVWTSRTDEQAEVNEELEFLLPLRLLIAREPSDRQLWNEYVDRHHYLGYKHPIGSHLRYFIVDAKNRKLGCLLFSFASRVLPDRDHWIGWDSKARQKRLNLVINNNRYLIFPWVKVKNLASKALSMACHQIQDDWSSMHGYRPLLLETFVDTSEFKGTCYRAANWIKVGKTNVAAGNKNGDRKAVKDIYLYPLAKNCQSRLISGEAAPGKMKPVVIESVAYESNAPFVLIWQKLITAIDEICHDFDSLWRKRKRLINTQLLVLFIFRLVFSKNKQGYGVTITELWDQCKLAGVDLPQKAPIAASAFCAARAKLDENIFKSLNSKIIESYDTPGCNAEWLGHRLFAVDGTKMNLPRPLMRNGYKFSHEKAHYPFGLVSCLYQLRSKIPVDFDLQAATGERTYALTHLNKLAAGDIVVYDRGYFSYTMLYWHIKKGIHPIFRMPVQTYTVIAEFIASEKHDDVVEISLTRERFTRLRKKDPGVDAKSLKIRLIKYRIGNELYALGTTLLDKEIHSADDLAKLYHERWDIEELFKMSKVLIEVQDFHGQSERGVKQELYAHFVIITLSRIFSNHIENVFNPGKDDNLDRQTRVNMKNCLLTIARNLETLLIQQNMVLRKTLSNIVNSIMNCRQKMRPNRSYERRSKKPFSKWQKNSKINRANPSPDLQHA